MSRGRLVALLAVSVFATAAVLAQAGGSKTSHATIEAALKTVTAVRTAAPVAAATPTPTTVPAAAVSGTGGGGSVSPVASGDDSVSDSGSSAPATAAEATPTPTPKPTATPAPPKPSKIGHVFVIALAGTGYQATFGADSAMPYLAKELRPDGAILSGFAPLDAADLPNYIAFAGGQPPNADTRAGCTTFSDFPDSAVPDKKGVVPGAGCNYPNSVISLGDQVSATGDTWRAYSESQGDRACRVPTTPDSDEFAARHDPFVFFRSVVDLGDCPTAAVDLRTMEADLKAAKTSPNLAFIAPNLCHDGTEATCADGTPGGPAATDAFLHEWVPKITGSAAYRKDGALFITFLSGPSTDATGALVLSPFAKRGSLYAKPYGPYSLLRSVEDLLGLKPLAKATSAPSFAKLLFPHAF